MPFNQTLRSKLSILKGEFDSGLISLSRYEELCRTCIREYGASAYQSGNSIVDNFTENGQLKNVHGDPPIYPSLNKESSESFESNKRENEEFRISELLEPNKLQKLSNVPRNRPRRTQPKKQTEADTTEKIGIYSKHT